MLCTGHRWGIVPEGATVARAQLQPFLVTSFVVAIIVEPIKVPSDRIFKMLVEVLPEGPFCSVVKGEQFRHHHRLVVDSRRIGRSRGELEDWNSPVPVMGNELTLVILATARHSCKITRHRGI